MDLSDYTSQQLNKMKSFMENSPAMKNSSDIVKIKGELALRIEKSINIKSEIANGFFRWKWNNRIGRRNAPAYCLIISKKGKLHLFTGNNIQDVAEVTNTHYHKQGKWSYTLYEIKSPTGTTRIEGHGILSDLYSKNEMIAMLKGVNSNFDGNLRCLGLAR